MAGLNKSYSADKIILGPSDLWVNVALPGAAARLTLDAGGTPDATANPNGVHVGMTEAGWEVTIKSEIQKFMSDEFDSPHLSRIITTQMMIKGNGLQVYDWPLLAKLTPAGTYGSNTNTSTGYEELTVGGKSAVTTMPIALIGPELADPTKFWVFQLYKTFNQAGVVFQVTRKDQSKAPFEFEGLAVVSRAAGDTIGNFWKQGPPAA